MNDADEIKQRLNIIDIVGERVKLKKTGRNFKGLCPFHNEKTPSFIVSPDRQTFHCFGCGKGGSVIDFVMEYEHLEFFEALEQLAGRAGVVLTKRTEGGTVKQRLREQIYKANKLASDYYSYLLTGHTLGESALMYLRNRGISDKSVKTFSLGYSLNNWDGLYRFLKKKGFDDTVLLEGGLVLRGNRGCFDRFRGRVMFGLKDHRGRVVGFSGRILDSSGSSKKEAKYINTSETPVYVKGDVLYGLDVTKDTISKSGEALIMEGEFDVISSFQAGISNAVAIKGSALTEGHVLLLKRFCERIIFALDNDIAGDMAARRGISLAESSGLDMRVMSVPFGKDPDEAVREDPLAFKKALKDAQPIYDYFITSAVNRFDQKTAFGKRKISDELLPVLRMIDNPIVQAHYVKRVARTLDVPEETIIKGVQKLKPVISFSKETESSERPSGKEDRNLTRQEKVERYMASLFFQGSVETLLPSLSSSGIIPDIKTEPVKRIFQVLEDYVKTHTAFRLQEFADALPNELLPTLDLVYLADLEGVVDKPEIFSSEWERTLLDLQRMIIREKIKDISKKLQEEDSLQLTTELSKLTTELSGLEKPRKN